MTKDDGATQYGAFGVFDGTSTTQTSRAVPVPAGTLSNLVVSIATNPGTGARAWTYTVMKNGLATSMTCSITAGLTTCSHSATTVVFLAGDTISLRIVPNSTGSGGPSSSTMAWSAILT